MIYPVRIEGKIQLSDGSVTSFSIDPDLGWQQWGQPADRLGDTVDLLDALGAASAEHGLDLRDQDQDEDEDEDEDEDDPT